MQGNRSWDWFLFNILHFLCGKAFGIKLIRRKTIFLRYKQIGFFKKNLMIIQLSSRTFCYLTFLFYVLCVTFIVLTIGTLYGGFVAENCFKQYLHIYYKVFFYKHCIFVVILEIRGDCFFLAQWWVAAFGLICFWFYKQFFQSS